MVLSISLNKFNSQPSSLLKLILLPSLCCCIGDLLIITVNIGLSFSRPVSGSNDFITHTLLLCRRLTDY